MVRLASGRIDQVRREPAEEVRGHRQRPLLPRRLSLDLASVARHRAVLGRARGEDLPRRQPAHQAVPVLAMADPRGERSPSRRDLPRRGLHPAEGDEEAREDRLPAVLHLLHLAQHEAGAHRVRHRADGRDGRVLPAELLRQHAGHQPVLSPDQRSGGFHRARHARRDAVERLGPVQRLRDRRGHADARQGGISRTRRNTSSRPGTSTDPATSRSTSAS